MATHKPQSVRDPNTLITPREFFSRLSISYRTGWRWLSEGKLPRPDLRQGRVLRWRPETIENWLAESAE